MARCELLQFRYDETAIDGVDGGGIGVEAEVFNETVVFGMLT